jgi:glyoxylase-like metal-dependent hydrolase (beta-lactamase superfamily II)
MVHIMEVFANAHIHQFQDDLYLISLPVPIKGFDGFIGAWFHAKDPMVLVDVGPAVSVPHLLSALSEIGRGEPELILLTHIHIDHAGGIGHVAEAFPRARVVCHPKGVNHLIDPERLWRGSVKILGDIAKAYEPMAPLSAKQVIEASQLRHARIQSIETPGHAAHHVSYMIGDLLFAGEAGGVCLPLPDQTIYLRPATPPRFFLETSLESIDRLISKRPEQICYGHIGQRGDAVHMLETHRRQLLHWLDIIRPLHSGADGDDAKMQACVEHLLAADPLLNEFFSLPPEVQERERDFMHNSIRGYWGYLEC